MSDFDFGRDDDDLFRFDEDNEETGAADDLFGDTDGDDDLFSGFDDDLGGRIDFGEDDETAGPMSFDPDEDDFAESGGGPSRTFVIIAAIFIILLLAGFGLIVFIVLGGRGPTDLQYTATSIVQTNAAVALALQRTETQNAISAFATQTIDAYTDTPTVTLTSTPTATDTPDTSGTATAEFQATIAAANTAVAATATESQRVFELTLTTQPDVVTVVPQEFPTLDTGQLPVSTVIAQVPTQDNIGSGGGGDTRQGSVSAPTQLDLGVPTDNVALIESPLRIELVGSDGVSTDTYEIISPVAVTLGERDALGNQSATLNTPVEVQLQPLDGGQTLTATLQGDVQFSITPLSINEDGSQLAIITQGFQLTFGNLSGGGDLGGTQIALDATPTRQTDTGLPTPIPTIPVSSVQMTATAFAQVFNQTPVPGGVTNTPTSPRPTPVSNNLPDTGLFDEVFQGSPMAIFAIAFGLLGVIVVSRRVRSNIRKNGK